MPTQQSQRRILQWTQRVLFTGAVLMFGYDGFVLMDAWVFQSRQDRRLDHLLADRQPSQVSPADSRGVLSTVAAGGVIGRIVIPHLSLSVIVAEGVDSDSAARSRPYSRHGTAGTGGKHRDFRPPRYVLSTIAKHSAA